MKLNKRIQNLVNQEIISTKAAEEIMVFEQIRKTGIAWKMMYTISCLLIGLGFILLISSNWDDIPDLIKLLGNFSIFGGILYALSWAFINKKKTLKEGLLLASFLFVGATIGLIGQIFNLEGGWHSFAIGWAILSSVFVILSRSRILNIVWLLLLFSGLNFNFLWSIIFRIFNLHPVFSIIVNVSACALLSYAGKTLYKAIGGIIILPKAFADLATLTMYYLGVICTFVMGNRLYHYYFHQEEPFFNWSAIGANAVAFTFLGCRLLLALYKDNLKSFTRNSYIVCAYIIGMFLIRMENSFLKGIIFIIGGIFLFGLVYLLQKFVKKINVKGGLNE